MKNLLIKLLFLVLMSQVVFSATTLSSGVAQNGSVSEGTWKYYTISASAGSTVTVNMTGLSSDVDLYVRKGSQPTINSYDERPYNGGTNSESATVTVNGSTTVYIGVQGYTSGSFTIKATVNGGSSSGDSSSGGSSGGSSNSGTTTLSSGVAQNGSVSEGAWKYYTISASAGSTVTVNMTGLSSDVDLYVRKGSQPTMGTYDARPYNGGTESESATVTVNGSTTVYIGIQGYTSGSFTIKATVNSGSSSGDSSSGDSIALSAPSLITPANGSDDISSTSNTTFRWNNVDGATVYRIVVSQDASFSGFIEDGGSSRCEGGCWTETTTSKNITKDGFNLANHTYYWRVRAGNSDSAGAWSEVYSFTTINSVSEIAQIAYSNAVSQLDRKNGYINGQYYDWVDSSYTYCARLVRASFNKEGKYAYAITMYDNYNELDLVQTAGNPSKGDVIFYDKHSTNGYAGHVGIADGEGNIISVYSKTQGVLSKSITSFSATYLGFVRADDFNTYY